MSGNVLAETSSATSQDVEVQRVVDDRLTKFLDLFSGEHHTRFKNARQIFEPFWFDEAAIRKIDKTAVECLSELQPYSGYTFQSKTRFTNLFEDRQDNVEDFLDKATDIDEPESVQISWSSFSILSDGQPIAANISIILSTERNVVGQETGLHEINRAFIHLETSGSEQDWVTHTFRRLSPIVEGKTLGGIYRPLYVFRSKFFNSVLAQTVGFVGLFVGMNLSARYLQSEDRLTKSEILEKIVASGNISTKIDELSKRLLDPSHTPWWEPIIVVTAGAITYGLAWTVLGLILPRLAPPSFIAIGTSADRAQRRFTTYNTIVFTVLGGGVLVPLLVSGIFGI